MNILGEDHHWRVTLISDISLLGVRGGESVNVISFPTSRVRGSANFRFYRTKGSAAWKDLAGLVCMGPHICADFVVGFENFHNIHVSVVPSPMGVFPRQSFFF